MTLVIHGPDPSSYLRAAKLVCEEKGVAYEQQPVDLHSEAHFKLHPFGKVPIVDHGDKRLYETSAILRYVDAAFEGPALVPADPFAAGEMEQWISTFNAYYYDDWAPNYVLAYLFPKDGNPDRERIDAAAEKIKQHFAQMHAWLEGRKWFAGESVSLADILIAPLLNYVLMFPEGKALAQEFGNVGKFHSAWTERPTFAKACPPPQLG